MENKCEDNKCSKLDMKDRAIKMLRDSFEKRLTSIEKYACRSSTQELISKREALLKAFEDYLKEVLVC